MQGYPDDNVEFSQYHAGVATFRLRSTTIRLAGFHGNLFCASVQRCAAL
jgi:hypothetical protein